MCLHRNFNENWVWTEPLFYKNEPNLTLLSINHTMWINSVENPNPLEKSESNSIFKNKVFHFKPL